MLRSAIFCLFGSLALSTLVLCHSLILGCLGSNEVSPQTAIFRGLTSFDPGHPTLNFSCDKALGAELAPNTQAESIRFTSPDEALSRIDLPSGFDVSGFAAEPMVQQPIAMAFDTRGRLWVAECFTYAENGKFETELRDRIVILEDSDHDGRADRRTVFWDQGQRLTSLEIGFGGVWVLCTPHLLFIPDRDGDDQPDAEPTVVLDGWVSAGHTLVNGLRWGPDGWLYGRHGIQGTSEVGTPDAPPEDRVSINCGIWRYHPQRRRFEVVCHGTTNPWGMDWNDHGQLFFINTVIGHLWQVLPGAHYRRMYGDDLRPELYELIEQTADHVHWDDGHEEWTAQRKGVSTGTSRAGGGHAHVGLMFYLGDNWPLEYRDELFTLNLHGRRINRDHLEREGATYVGRHRPDFVTWGDAWFRGIDLAYGPDGGVYVLDWSDIGECHEADGVHRTSGRIYKISWRGGERKPANPNQRQSTWQRFPAVSWSRCNGTGTNGLSGKLDACSRNAPRGVWIWTRHAASCGICSSSNPR